MSTVTFNEKENTVTITLTGRIDSSNAAQVEQELTGLRASQPQGTLILDAEELAYISSAGLRVILRMRKAEKDMRIINVSSDVYEIFDMTGFTEMIPIEKGYRHLSVEGCEVIGEGANGKVYRLDPDTIIKVYRNPDSLSDIHRERELARRAFVLGIPTAIPYDVVKVGNSYGSVFELLNARSFSKILAQEPERLDEITAMFVNLLKKIHGTQVLPEDMPDIRDTVLNWVAFLKEYLPAEKWGKLNRLVEEVPVSHGMIHGDYHTKNVMMQDGEALLIDMDTLAQGNPVFEFASVFNAFVGFSVLDEGAAMAFQGLPRELCLKIWKKILILYFETEDEERLQEIENKAALIGYTRLMRRLIRRNGLDTEEGKNTIAFYRSQIEELLDKVDTLLF